MYTRYFCLEADDPYVQEDIAGTDEYEFTCVVFINGLADFRLKAIQLAG